MNITAVVQTEIKSIITAETTKRILDTVSNSEEIKSESQKIIVALVKQQREMEDTFKTKMDRAFKEKLDVIQSSINTMMEDIEMRVDNWSTKINNQIDTLDLRQSRLADENNILYKQSIELKVDISKLQIDINSIDNQIQNMNKNRSPQNKPGPGIEPATQNQSSGAQDDGAVTTPTFMSEYPINTIGGPSPILIQFKFIYLLGNHHVKEVESYKL